MFPCLIYISAQMELRPVSMFELFFGVLFSDLIPTMLYLPACSLVVFLVQKAIKYSLISTSIDIRLAFNEQPLSILEYSLCNTKLSFFIHNILKSPRNNFTVRSSFH